MKLTFQEQCFRDKFRNYRSHQKKIQKLEAAIVALKEKQGLIPTVKTKVKSSMAEWPFIEIHETVEALDPVKSLQLERMIWRRECELRAYFQELEEVDKFILAIDDDLTQQIFELHFLQGVSQAEIAEQLHYSRSYITKLITREFKRHR